MSNTLVKFTPLAVFISTLSSTSAFADDALLKNKIDQLSEELKVLKAEMTNLHTQTDAIASLQESNASSTSRDSKTTGATLWGYGEINYTRPKDNGNETQMDLRRAVFGIGYKFDDRTRFVSEYEIEHAIASADDQGEVEVEQFYIDHQLKENTHLKAGLFLIPAGLLNEGHEPNSYFGVERNFVETAIIPTTWREGGVALFGSMENGLAWDAGITTTVDLSGWDASSDEGRESPLGSVHQELQLAKAHDLGTYGALNYRGTPGLVIGGSVFTSKVSQANLPIAEDARMALWDAHVRWAQGNWDLSALYAKGTFSNTQALNQTFAGLPSPVPKEFFGWYTQAAYKVWQNGAYAFTPFVRYEGINTANAYEPIALGLGVAAAKTDYITTLGISFNLHPNVVIKLDYQDFDQDSSRNRFNLGLGLAF
jgi:phosphate-selective porin